MTQTTPESLADPASFCVQASASRARGVRLSAVRLAVGYRVGRAGSDRATERVLAAGLDLSLLAGELVCLLGPNGAGKSTLLRTLAGLQEPLAGEVRVDGATYDAWSPRELARRLAVVLTDRALPGLMSGEELVRLGRHPHTPWTGRLAADDHAAVRRALAQVDAEHLARRPLAEMSDGERQKVTIARALAQDAEVLVLDEVTAFLDLPRRVEIVRLLRRLAHDAGQAIVLATHDLDLALRSADRLWLLGQGGELLQGVPEDLVLDGSFERVFAGEGVEFDRTSGAFRLHRRLRGTAAVLGAHDRGADGRDADVAILWTRRALDRIGFELCDVADRPDLVVEIVVREDKPDDEGSADRVVPVSWTCTFGDSTTEHGSLGHLIASISAASAAGAASVVDSAETS